MLGNNKTKKAKHDSHGQPRSPVYILVRNGMESHFKISVK